MRLAMGYRSFRTAWRTIQGMEAMHLIGKGRVRRVPKHKVMAHVRFIHKLFGLAAEPQAIYKHPALGSLQHSRFQRSGFPEWRNDLRQLLGILKNSCGSERR